MSGAATPEIKRMRCQLDVKQVDVEAGTFEGHASIFNVPDDGMPPDVIMPGAFTKTVQEWGPTGANRIKILALHRNDWLPIGKPLELREDTQGLWFKAKISDTTLGRDVLTLLRDGVLTEMSIGFTTVKADLPADRAARLVREVRLYELSPVTWAMHPMAKITGVKDAHCSTCALSPEPGSSTPAESAAPSACDPELLQSLKANTALLHTLTGRTV